MMTQPNFLFSDETAEAGQQLMPKTNILWEAVFAVSSNGTSRLLCYVEGPKLAQFIAEKVNEAQLEATPSILVKLTKPQKKLLISLFEEADGCHPDSRTCWVEVLPGESRQAKKLVELGLIEHRQDTNEANGQDVSEARMTQKGFELAKRLTFRISGV